MTDYSIFLDENYLHKNEDKTNLFQLSNGTNLFICKNDYFLPHFHFESKDERFGAFSIVDKDKMLLYFLHGKYYNFLTKEEEKELLDILKEKYLYVKQLWNELNPEFKQDIKVTKLEYFDSIVADFYGTTSKPFRIE